MSDNWHGERCKRKKYEWAKVSGFFQTNNELLLIIALQLALQIQFFIEHSLHWIFYTGYVSVLGFLLKMLISWELTDYII